MKVRTPSTGSYVYPDVSIACGEVKIDDERSDILLNPMLVIEVLSPGTESYDRGKKFQRYREIPSLQEYILIAQDSPRIERFVRQDGNVWQFNDAQGLEESLDLTSIGCSLRLADVYQQVEFEADRDETTGQPSEAPPA